MRILALFLTAALGGTMAFACREPSETLVVYIEPSRDASASLTLPEDEAEIPCAPRAVLKTVCQRCHTRPMQNGAPFPLVHRSDIVTQTYGGVIVQELMIGEVTAGRMPLQPVTISGEDKETLLEWLNAGAPAVPETACLDAGTADVQTEDVNDAH